MVMQGELPQGRAVGQCHRENVESIGHPLSLHHLSEWYVQMETIEGMTSSRLHAVEGCVALQGRRGAAGQRRPLSSSSSSGILQRLYHHYGKTQQRK
jgi:hypothetical protein